MLSLYIGIVPWSSLKQYQGIKALKKPKTNCITLYDKIPTNPLNNGEGNLS